MTEARWVLNRGTRQTDGLIAFYIEKATRLRIVSSVENLYPSFKAIVRARKNGETVQAHISCVRLVSTCPPVRPT